MALPLLTDSLVVNALHEEVFDVSCGGDGLRA